MIALGFLIVIAARPGIEKRKSTEIAAELRYLFRKLDMFRPEPDAPADGTDSGKP